MTPGPAIGSGHRRVARLTRFGLTLAWLALASALARPAPAAEAAREPAASDAGATIAAATELPWSWRLAGVVVSPDLREALFVTEGASRTLREGEVIDGWTLAVVRPQDVTLQHQGSEKRLAVDQLPAGDADAAPAIAVGQSGPVLQDASAVRTAARTQQKEQKAAESALTAATKKMMAHHRNIAEPGTP